MEEWSVQLVFVVNGLTFRLSPNILFYNTFERKSKQYYCLSIWETSIPVVTPFHSLAVTLRRSSENEICLIRRRGLQLLTTCRYLSCFPLGRCWWFAFSLRPFILLHIVCCEDLKWISHDRPEFCYYFFAMLNDSKQKIVQPRNNTVHCTDKCSCNFIDGTYYL